MGSTSAAQAFAFAPNFQNGIKAAARIIVTLRRQSKIVDPAKPAVKNFVSLPPKINIFLLNNIVIFLYHRSSIRVSPYCNHFNP